MKKKQPSDREVIKAAQFIGPLLSSVIQKADLRVRRAVPIIGPPRKTHLPNWHHPAIRACFTEACLELEDRKCDWLKMVEEPEGVGLDAVICRVIPDMPFAMRWGLSPDGTVFNRGGSSRQRQVECDGFLWPDFDEIVSGLRMFTLSYLLGDNFGRTIAGLPTWWLSSVRLSKETIVSTDLLYIIDTFDKPEMVNYHMPPTVVTINERKSEQGEFSGIIDDLIRKTG